MGNILKSSPELARSKARKPTNRIAWISVLTLLSAISPLACDMYLPAFPDMAAGYSTNEVGLQLTMTTFLLGMGAGQLLLGPLADRFGRKNPLLISLVVCTIAGIACALAPSIELLILFRFIQGLAGAGSIVISRAVVADTASGAESQKLFSVMAAVGGLAPIIAPLFGAVVLEFAGWREIFWVLVALTVLMLISSFIWIPESLAKDQRQKGGTKALVIALKRMVQDRFFVGYSLVLAFSFAVMLAYIPTSPFVLQNIHGMTSMQFSLTFATNAVGIALASWFVGRMAGKIPARTTIGWGVVLQVIASVAAVVLSIFGTLPTWALLIALFVAVSSIGLIAGPVTALALDRVPYAVGTGAALLGALQFGLGAIVSPLVGLGGEDIEVAMLVVMAIMACCTFAVLQLTRQRPVKGKSARLVD